MKKNVLLLMSMAALLLAGPALAECPPGFPIDCGDDWCCPADSTCAEDGQCLDNKLQTCPPDYPVDCDDGYCCPENTECGAYGQCYLTDDSLDGKLSKQCPDSTLTCITEFCNTDGIYCCPPGYPYLNHNDCLCYDVLPDVPSYSQCVE